MNLNKIRAKITKRGLFFSHIGVKLYIVPLSKKFMNQRRFASPPAAMHLEKDSHGSFIKVSPLFAERGLKT